MTDTQGQSEKTKGPQQNAKITGRDLEFLPAALEILETPSPPVATFFMLTICAFATVALAWAFFGKLDVNAVAQGKIETLGFAKVIETIDAGKVARIDVSIGAIVRKGDPLIEFDPAEARADFQAAQNALFSAQAETARRQAATDIGVRLLAHKKPSKIAEAANDLELLVATTENLIWPTGLPHTAKARETAVLTADLAQLVATLSSLGTDISAKRAAIDRLSSSITNDETLVQSMSQLKEAQVALSMSLSEVSKILGNFVADNQNRLAEVEKRADDARQAVNKAQSRLSQTKLYAPIDGIVSKLAATTVGQVFTTGQQIMVISPGKPVLQVEALMPNVDIGFVKIGQEVTIKVDAFPFTRFGTVKGRITRIAAEAVEEQEAKRQLATAVSSANESSAGSGSVPGQAPSFVFPITIALDKASLSIEGAEIPFSSGMTVTAEIHTGERRIIDYLLSPISKTTSEAFKER